MITVQPTAVEPHCQLIVHIEFQSMALWDGNFLLQIVIVLIFDVNSNLTVLHNLKR